MARQIVRPQIDELEALRAEATQNGQVSESEWVKRNCELNASILRKDPRRYRSFGPYWWVLKDAMLHHGITEFGDFVDMEGCTLCKHDSPFLTLLEAWLYSENAIDMGLMYSNEHTISFLPEEVEDEPDVRVYTLADDTMELLAVQYALK